MDRVTVKPDQPDVISIGELEIRYLMDGTVTGAASGMFELIIPPGARVPPAHSHSDNEELMYCLEGKIRASVGGVELDLAPGERSYTPCGVVHAFSNPHGQLARALVILTPDIGAQYFRDVAKVVGSPGGPDPAKMAEVMSRYGLVLSPPKPAGNGPPTR
jgi:quercetin dioxygenase-like cupin family protein